MLVVAAYLNFNTFCPLSVQKRQDVTAFFLFIGLQRGVDQSSAPLCTPLHSFASCHVDDSSVYRPPHEHKGSESLCVFTQ